MADRSDEISRFNEANFAIQRLHFLWIKIHIVTESGNADLNKWKFLLDSIWRELRADVERRPEKEKWIKENKRLRENIAKARGTNQIYEALNERHEFLRIIQDRVGKGGSWQDSASTLFE